MVNPQAQESLKLVHQSHEQAMPATEELVIRLGCVGCEHEVNLVVVAESNVVLNEISAGMPFAVKTTEFGWRRSNVSCKTGCVFQEQIKQTEQAITKRT